MLAKGEIKTEVPKSERHPDIQLGKKRRDAKQCALTRFLSVSKFHP